MRFSILVPGLLMLASACGGVAVHAGGDTPSTSEKLGGAGPAECLIETYFLTEPAEMKSDLQAAVDPSFIFDPGAPGYQQVRIPGALSYVLDSNHAFADSFPGWGIVPQSLVRDQGFTAAGLYARITSFEQTDPTKVFAQKQYLVTKAIFDALTQVTEERVDHVARPASFDSSWTRFRRATAHGRLICDKLMYLNGAGEADTTPIYTCVLSKLEFSEKQVFPPTSFCPAP